MSTLSQTTETRLTEVAVSSGSRGNAELDAGVREMISRLEDQLKTFRQQMEAERRERNELEQRYNLFIYSIYQGVCQYSY